MVQIQNCSKASQPAGTAVPGGIPGREIVPSCVRARTDTSATTSPRSKKGASTPSRLYIFPGLPARVEEYQRRHRPVDLNVRTDTVVRPTLGRKSQRTSKQDHNPGIFSEDRAKMLTKYEGITQVLDCVRRRSTTAGTGSTTSSSTSCRLSKIRIVLEY
eukprot:1142087-Rhodomonas_salina.2